MLARDTLLDRSGPFCFTSTEARWLIKDGDGGGGGGVPKESRLDR